VVLNGSSQIVSEQLQVSNSLLEPRDSHGVLLELYNLYADGSTSPLAQANPTFDDPNIKVIPNPNDPQIQQDDDQQNKKDNNQHTSLVQYTWDPATPVLDGVTQVKACGTPLYFDIWTGTWEFAGPQTCANLPAQTPV
jgi:hypothetical protein